MRAARAGNARLSRAPRLFASALAAALGCLLSAHAWATGTGPADSAGAASQPRSPSAEITVTDDSGRVLRLPRPAQRVITLSPHLTELAFAAGAGAAVVGVGRYSDYPDAAAQLPQVGDALSLNLEAMARLRPDLILVWQSGTPARQRQRLQALGVPVFENEIATVADLAATLRRLGTLMGSTGPAEAATRDVEMRWAALLARHSGRPPVRVFYSIWDAPLMTVNGRHLIQQAITACGGTNAFADLPTLTPTIGWDAAVRSNPELIVTAQIAEAQTRAAWSRFGQVAAVRGSHIVGLPADLLTRMTPRFIEGAEQLCHAIEAVRSSRAKQTR